MPLLYAPVAEQADAPASKATSLCRFDSCLAHQPGNCTQENWELQSVENGKRRGVQMRPSGYRRHLYYFHIPPGGHVSIVDTRVVCLAGEYTADLLCRMAGRRIPDGAAPGSMPGCGTTIFLSFDYSFWRYGTCAQASTPERFYRRLKCRSGPRLCRGLSHAQPEPHEVGADV